MPFDAKNYAEIRDRRRREVLTMGASLMSNTKWREVLQCAASHGLWFQVALVGDDGRDRERLCPPLPPAKCLESMVADAGLTGGGPHEYWEILWVRYPRVFRNQTLDAFLASVQDLGVLPLVATDAHIEIRGYETPAA
jgi:hypothetical protein